MKIGYILTFSGLVVCLLWGCNSAESPFENFSEPAIEHAADSINNRPAPRGGAPAVWIPHNQRMLFFGGMSPIMDDTWAYKTSENTWQHIAAENRLPPPPRCHHSLVADKMGEVVLMFGGFAINNRYNGTWRYDAKENYWEKLDIQGPLPDKRCLHTATYIESTNQMLIFGGIVGAGTFESNFFQDTWLLNIDVMEWEKVQAGVNPGKRAGAISFYAGSENSVYLWGGRKVDTFPTNLWKFNVEQKTWQKVETTGQSPEGKEDPVYFWNQEDQILYVALGRNTTLENPHPKDAYELNMESKKWQKLPEQNLPSGRWRSSVAYDFETDTGYMFGGWIGHEDKKMNDIWKYNMENEKWTLLAEHHP